MRALAAALLAAVALPLAGTAAHQGAELSGRVLDESNGRPIQGAQIELQVGRQRLSHTTDATGRYVIAGIPEGIHELRVTHRDYATIPTYDLAEIRMGLRVTASTTRVTREISLAPLVWITGRAVRPNGAPVSGVFVNAELVQGTLEGWPIFGSRGQAFTRDDGAFRIRVRPGRYTLKSFGPAGAASREGLWYYPGVRDARQAGTFAATAASAPVTFVIPDRPYPPLDIEVLAPDGSPLPNATVAVRHWQDYLSDAVNSEWVVTNAQGIASLEMTGPGSHVIQARYPSGDPPYRPPTPATGMFGGRIEVMDAPLRKTLKLLPTFDQCVIVGELGAGPGTKVHVAAYQAVEAGSFHDAARAEGVAGERLWLRGLPRPANLYVSGGSSLMQEPLRVDGPSPGCINIVIKPAPQGVIKGSVLLPAGDWVPIFSVHARRSGSTEPGLSHSAQMQADGSFELTRLDAGVSYDVIVATTRMLRGQRPRPTDFSGSQTIKEGTMNARLTPRG